MDKMQKEILQLTKEIIVKFIEAGKISPTSFPQIFPSIYQVITETLEHTEKNIDEQTNNKNNSQANNHKKIEKLKLQS